MIEQQITEAEGKTLAGIMSDETFELILKDARTSLRVSIAIASLIGSAVLKTQVDDEGNIYFIIGCALNHEQLRKLIRDVEEKGYEIKGIKIDRALDS